MSGDIAASVAEALESDELRYTDAELTSIARARLAEHEEAKQLSEKADKSAKKARDEQRRRARRVGEILVIARGRYGSGRGCEWGAYLAQVGINERTARRYMGYARAIENSDTSANVSEFPSYAEAGADARPRASAEPIAMESYKSAQLASAIATADCSRDLAEFPSMVTFGLSTVERLVALIPFDRAELAEAMQAIEVLRRLCVGRLPGISGAKGEA